jgi:hypothetical protein
VRNCAPGNLEIPGSRFARPGMTLDLVHYFVGGTI